MSITRIAKAADVSYATAWRVINNHPLAGEKAIRSVRDAMNRHGLVPRPLPGKKRGRPRKTADGIRTHNLAVLQLRGETLVSAAIIRTVQRLLTEKRLNLIFAHVEHPDDLPHTVRTGNVDGILGYGQFPPSQITPALLRMPAVWMMSRSDDRQDPWGDRVQPDNAALGQAAGRLALRLAAGLYAPNEGSPHIGVLNPNDENPLACTRCDAFRRYCQQAGAHIQNFVCVGQPLIDLAAIQLVQQFIAAPRRPLILFSPRDQCTLRIHRLLLAQGIQPGRDVHLVSIDRQQSLLDHMDPPPPSVILPRDEIARLAVERLFWRMKNGPAAPQITISVGPPPDSNTETSNHIVPQ